MFCGVRERMNKVEEGSDLGETYDHPGVILARVYGRWEPPACGPLSP